MFRRVFANPEVSQFRLMRLERKPRCASHMGSIVVQRDEKYESVVPFGWKRFVEDSQAQVH